MDIITDDTKNPYQHAKVYKLVNNVDDKIYVGSTCNELSKRKYSHKAMGRRKTDRYVYQHLNEIGWDNVSIILIEEVISFNKNQLRMREQYYIDLLKPELNSICAVNLRCPHDRIKYICKNCEGSKICSHNKRKSQCRDCGGGSICSHNKQKSNCKQCNGDKYYCHECEIGFSCKSALKSHYNSKRHHDTYNRLINECFND